VSYLRFADHFVC